MYRTSYDASILYCYNFVIRTVVEYVNSANLFVKLLQPWSLEESSRSGSDPYFERKLSEEMLQDFLAVTIAQLLKFVKLHI